MAVAFRDCCGGDASRQSLVRALGGVDLVEAVDLGLQLCGGLGEGLLIQLPEQGLMEPLVFCGWSVCTVAGDRFDAERGHVGDQLAFPSAAWGI